MPTVMAGIKLLAAIGVLLVSHLCPCYIIFAMFFNINDLFNTQDYFVEIYEGNQCVQREQVSMPQQMAQGQFMQLCQQLKETGRPMRVKMIRHQEIEGRGTPLECSIEYQTWSD